MTFFILIVALMLAAALGFVLWPLLSGPSARTLPAAEARNLLKLLDESRASGNEGVETREDSTGLETLGRTGNRH